MAQVDAQDQGDQGHLRNTNHDLDSFWNSTRVKPFDTVMAHSHIKFSEMDLEDLVGDNSVVLMSELVQLCARNLPICRHTK